MSLPLIGLIAGLVFGVITIALMAPMAFPDKPAALVVAAFIERFAIGLVIGCVQLSWAGWLVGFLFGFLLSSPQCNHHQSLRADYFLVGAVGKAWLSSAE